MEDKMININVIVADRPYRLKVNAQEEGLVRSAAREINQKVKEYQQVFTTKDKQDYLAMIALQHTVEGMKAGEAKVNPDPALETKLDALDQLLARHLSR